jgi:glycosyltransferase involved in cell wall biosynthesis
LPNRVVFFLQGRNVPAARFRGLAVARALAARGIDVSCRIPVPSVYGDWGVIGRGSWRRALVSPLAVVSRLRQLRHLRPDDFIFFQRPMLELPTCRLERIAATGRRSLFDFDDAIYLNRATRKKFPRIVELVDWVVAGNRYLAEATGAPRKTVVIPTAVDTGAWARQTTRDTQGAQVVVGWTGLSSNYRQLALAAPGIARALARTGARFVLISDAPPPASLACLRAEFVRWSAHSEVPDLSRLDIGVMPLPDGPYERGKCAFKLIQYMALGRPALASPVGANAEVVTDGVDGFLPRGDSEWEEKLSALIADPALREAVGTRARERVVSGYSLDAVVPLYMKILQGGGR